MMASPEPHISHFPPVVIGLNAVIVAVTEEVPRVLTVTHSNRDLVASDILQPTTDGVPSSDALPFGPLEPERHHTLERGLRSWVEQQTGLQLGYVEQLYTFGDRFRAPRAANDEPWLISVAYLALVREQHLTGDGGAHWHDWYDYFPWEDWRNGRPRLIDQTIQPALTAWREAATRPGEVHARAERIEVTFGLCGAPWDPERTLERYELLYEAGLVAEAEHRMPVFPSSIPKHLLGRSMALDHRRILATALGRLRGKIKYRPVVFELLPPTFTLLQLQRLVEALSGIRLHKQNFRRLVERGGLVEGTGLQDTRTRGRPAERFRFRREVLRERATPGVGLPVTASRG
jgi:hypothetical protein